MTSARKTAEDIKTFTEKLSHSLSQIRQIDDAAPGTSPHETRVPVSSSGDSFAPPMARRTMATFVR